MNRFVELCATTPAKMFGLFPRKGTIAVGSDADIVVFDPNRSATLSAKTLHMKVDYNPYEGRTVQGSPSFVISNGQVIVDGDAFVGSKGGGRFLRRGPSQAPAGL
jgi:dihydropyrimidinase